MSRIKRITNKLYEFAPTVTDKLTAQRFFQQACEAEEEQKSNDALELYHRALSYDGSLAMAWVNVGTIHFHCREFIRAEECYRKALEIDPKYLLACSNLANVLNEQGRLKEAVEYYYGAIAIDPQFQDAHYNLALVYRGIGEGRKALQHFRLYLRCRNGGDDVWASEARRNIRQLSKTIDMRIIRKDPTSVIATSQKPPIIVEQ